jgi:hypothetical protein
MAGDFSVRINRKEGVVEIEGSDKEWIATQLEKLAVVYESSPESAEVQESAPSAKDIAPQVSGTRKGDAAAKPSAGRGRKASRGSGRTSRDPELEKALTPELRSSLQAFVDERKKAWKNKASQAAIIATFLLDNLESDGWVDDSVLYTIYSVMGWSAPSNFRAQIDNGRNRSGYFGGWTNGRVQLTHAGEQFGRHGSKDA